MIQPSINKVQFAFRVVIDATSKGAWEKYVFEASWKEYKIQEQLYELEGKKVESYHELLKQNPKATQLNHLVGISVIPYIHQLNGKLYPIKDALKKVNLTFIDFELDIINSSNSDSTKHKIGITFYTPFYRYFGEINGQYLISNDTEEGEIIKTMMIPIQENFSISSIQLSND